MARVLGMRRRRNEVSWLLGLIELFTFVQHGGCKTWCCDMYTLSLPAEASLAVLESSVEVRACIGDSSRLDLQHFDDIRRVEGFAACLKNSSITLVGSVLHIESPSDGHGSERHRICIARLAVSPSSAKHRTVT
jgi:hypothetical protein